MTIVTCLKDKKKAKSFCSSAKIGKIQRLKKARLRERWKIVTTGNQANFFIEDVRCRSDLRSNDSSPNTSRLTQTIAYITLEEPQIGRSLEPSLAYYTRSTSAAPNYFLRCEILWKILKGSSYLESIVFCCIWLYSYMLLGSRLSQYRTNRRFS